MRVSDLFRDMHLATFGEIALLAAVGVFVSILIRTFAMRRRETDERLAHLPLEADSQEIRP